MNAPEPLLSEIYARNDVARSIVAGALAELPAATDLWTLVDQALTDVPVLVAVIGRLTAELAETRMDRANLLAAMRAAIGAQADGEGDPLYYVRDELDARYGAAESHGGAS